MYNVEPYSIIFNIHLTFPNGEELDPSALVHRPRGDRDLWNGISQYAISHQRVPSKLTRSRTTNAARNTSSESNTEPVV